MVTSSSMVGLARRKCDDIPEPWPITAAMRASGRWARVMSGARVWVEASPASGCLEIESPHASNQNLYNEASGFPLVAIVRTFSSSMFRTETVAVRPSSWNTDSTAPGSKTVPRRNTPLAKRVGSKRCVTAATPATNTVTAIAA